MRAPLALGALALLLSACGGSNRLAEYDFDDARVALVAEIPARPVLFTDVDYDARLDREDPLGSLVRAGTAVAKHVEVREARRRMDDALARVDVGARTAEAMLARSADVLGYRPVGHPREADFVLDVRIEHYGLVADSWDAAVRLVVEAEVELLDRAGRRRVWKQHVDAAQDLAEADVALGATWGNVYTARALSRLSTEELAAALADLADYTAAVLAAELRRDFYAAR